MWAAVAAAALLGFALPGCGGGGGPSKAGFTAAANGVCVQAARALAPLERQAAQAQRSADADAVFRALADLTRRRAQTTTPFLDQLDALPVPDSDHDPLKAWIAGLRQRTAVLTRLATAYAAQATADVARLSERDDALQQRDAAFADVYGMRSCAVAP